MIACPACGILATASQLTLAFYQLCMIEFPQHIFKQIFRKDTASSCDLLIAGADLGGGCGNRLPEPLF